MNWLLLAEIAYFIILIFVAIRIILDTRSSTKSMAYLLLVIFVPIVGIILYFSFGINYRKRKIYSKKLANDENLLGSLNESIQHISKETFEASRERLGHFDQIARMLLTDSVSELAGNNKVDVLVNGEKKFPDVLDKIRQAKNHIHIEYYIYKNDETGNELGDILIEKAREGVKVRFIYDDFGSLGISRELVPRLKKAGIETYPFHKIRIYALANRMNYRNHRKIIIVDGTVGYIGGINVSNEYVNEGSWSNNVYWRDTHISIEGPGMHFLQYIFLTDWNFASKQKLTITPEFFPQPAEGETRGDKVVQIAASGPDSKTPTILYSMLMAIYQSREELLITTPYFIPGEGIMDAMITSALSGVKVKLLVPEKSDSRIVNAAARSYYGELLAAGVEIYLYRKGFIHAKTLVADRMLAMVGTANMDHRSFDLNFEVNAVIYDPEVSESLARDFMNDLEFSKKLDLTEWENRPMLQRLFEKTMRLFSPLL